MEGLDTVIKVHNLFKDKKWIDKDIQSLVFEGFCQLLILLEEDEREFIIELVKNYHWITQGEYQERLINALNAINVDQLDGINKIYFFPIIKPEDENKAKSGDHLLYIIKASKRLLTKYAKVEFEYLKTFDQIRALQLLPNERLFLLDDYVGSGKSFDDCIAALEQNATLTKEYIKIVCIAIQEETFFNLNLEGYGTLKDIVVKRGISDYYKPIEQAQQKKALMLEIERHVLGAKPYSLGFVETEALITLMRTPDNTFPVFWRRFKKNGNLIDAPFARYEEQ
jgi:hypothetical protein